MWYKTKLFFLKGTNGPARGTRTARRVRQDWSTGKEVVTLNWEMMKTLAYLKFKLLNNEQNVNERCTNTTESNTNDRHS